MKCAWLVLKQQKADGLFETGPDGLTASEALAAISERVRRMVDDQYRFWREQLQPQLEDQRLRFHNYPDVPETEQTHLAGFFTKSVYPVLTPLAIDPAHPFPQLLNKSLNVIVELEGEDLSTDIPLERPRLPRVVPFAKQEDSAAAFLGHHSAPRRACFTECNKERISSGSHASNLWRRREGAKNFARHRDGCCKVKRGAAVR